MGADSYNRPVSCGLNAPSSPAQWLLCDINEKYALAEPSTVPTGTIGHTGSVVDSYGIAVPVNITARARAQPSSRQSPPRVVSARPLPHQLPLPSPLLTFQPRCAPSPPSAKQAQLQLPAKPKSNVHLQWFIVKQIKLNPYVHGYDGKDRSIWCAAGAGGQRSPRARTRAESLRQLTRASCLPQVWAVLDDDQHEDE